MVEEKRTCSACHVQELCERYDWEGGEITHVEKRAEQGVPIEELHLKRFRRRSLWPNQEDHVAPGCDPKGKEQTGCGTTSGGFSGSPVPDPLRL